MKKENGDLSYQSSRESSCGGGEAMSTADLVLLNSQSRGELMGWGDSQVYYTITTELGWGRILLCSATSNKGESAVLYLNPTKKEFDKGEPKSRRTMQQYNYSVQGLASIPTNDPYTIRARRFVTAAKSLSPLAPEPTTRAAEIGEKKTMCWCRTP